MKYPVYAYVNRGGNTVHEMICTTDSPIKQRALEDIANLLNCNIFNEAGIDQKTIDAIKKKSLKWERSSSPILSFFLSTVFTNNRPILIEACS